MNNNINIIFWEVKVSITNHLGKNPKNGGSPPKDNNTIKIEVFKIKFKFFI